MFSKTVENIHCGYAPDAPGELKEQEEGYIQTDEFEEVAAGEQPPFGPMGKACPLRKIPRLTAVSGEEHGGFHQSTSFSSNDRAIDANPFNSQVNIQETEPFGSLFLINSPTPKIVTDLNYKIICFLTIKK
jgi:hypothetical protein